MSAEFDIDKFVELPGDRSGSTVPPDSGPCSAPQLPAAPLLPTDLETRPRASSGQDGPDPDHDYDTCDVCRALYGSDWGKPA